MFRVLLLLFIGFVPIITANSNKLLDNIDYRFKKIGIEQGLSQSTILSIEQDSRGYIWFGTASGLNRYDGYEFLVYVNETDDTLSLSGNEISAIYEDREGFLWVGTTEGILNRFNPNSENFIHFDIAYSSDWYSSETEEFYNYPLSFSRNSKSTITSIVQDSSGALWIGTWGKGIVHINPETGKKRYFYFFRNRENSLSSNKITKLLIDSENSLWVGTFGGGLNRIVIESGENVKIENFDGNSNYDFGKNITALLEDSDHNLWIGSYGEGVTVIKNFIETYNKNYTIESFQPDFYSLSGDKKFDVMDIVEDASSNIWIGTYGDGLYCYSRFTEKVRNFSHVLGDPYSLSDNEIQSLFVDRSGILWIGTQLSSGINKLEMGNYKFSTVPILTGENKSLNDKIVWAISEDSENNIWIGTHRGGINIWNKSNDRFTYLQKEQKLPDNHIRSLIEDNRKNIWIGSYSGGLSLFERVSSSIKNISEMENYENSLSGNQVQTLFINNDSLLYVGTFGGGLNILNLNDYYGSGNFSFINFVHNPSENNSISDNKVYTIFKDSDKNIWIGTHGGGLNKFEQDSGTFVRYYPNQNQKNSQSFNRIMVINETFDGDLLVGTFGGGLYLFNKKTEVFERLNKRINFTFSDVYGIVNDTSDYWLSTDNGIFKINKELNSFTQFDLSDGLQSLEFSGGAYFRGNDGTFYFGGINGLNYFVPENIRADDFIPPIVITSIKVFDKPIRGERKNLVFDLDENYFSFEFASLDFRNSSKNKYKFMMEGLDSKWSYTNAGNRKVFYTNLSPGEYKFRVMGTNTDGIWSPNEANVEITILAPFWMRWWFISGLILLIGGLITFFINQRIRYLVALDKLKTNIAADLHDNVGAGLTEISILSELAYNDSQKNNTSSRHIEQISDLSRQLVESMSDIVWVVNPSRDSLYDLIVRLKDAYGELLSDLGIKLRTSNLDKLIDIRLPMDYRQNLYLILKEAINNCIKHSNCTHVDIVINVSKSNLIIKLQDDGIGFDLKKKYYGEGIANIKKRGTKIGGIINVNSKMGKGTTIEFEGKLFK